MVEEEFMEEAGDDVSSTGDDYSVTIPGLTVLLA